MWAMVMMITRWWWRTYGGQSKLGPTTIARFCADILLRALFWERSSSNNCNGVWSVENNMIWCVASGKQYEMVGCVWKAIWDGVLPVENNMIWCVQWQTTWDGWVCILQWCLGRIDTESEAWQSCHVADARSTPMRHDIGDEQMGCDLYVRMCMYPTLMV